MKKNLLKVKNIIFIVGPTAVRKSNAAYDLSRLIDGVIINADSKQVYREVPIITAQPALLEEKRLSYLYGHVGLSENYSLVRWKAEVLSKIDEAFRDCRVPIIVGGNAMYINMLINGISYYPKVDSSTKKYVDEEFLFLGRDAFYKSYLKQISGLKNTHKNDTYRLLREVYVFVQTGKIYSHFINSSEKDKLKFNYTCYVVLPSKEIIHSYIDNRFVKMVDNGAVEEVEALVKKNLINNRNVLSICGVKEIISYIKENISLKATIAAAQKSTKQYAKRQITWFKNKFNNAIHVDDYKKILDFND